jgi:hypothetical protein
MLFTPFSATRRHVDFRQVTRRDVPNPIIAMGGEGAIGGRFPAQLLAHCEVALRATDSCEGPMKLHRRQFLQLAAGAAALQTVSQIATTQTYVRIV